MGAVTLARGRREMAGADQTWSDKMTEAEFRARVARERFRVAQAVAKGRESQSSRAAGAPTRDPASPNFIARAARSLNESKDAKRAVGWAARQAGLIPGVVRGGVNTVQDLGNGIALVASLPTDRRARARVGQVARGAADYVTDRARNPHKVLRDVEGQLREVDRKLLAEATPMAPTVAGEFKRNFGIGMNRGETAVDLVSLPVGGPIARGVKIAGRLARPLTKADYIARGHDPKLAAYFAERYDGRGHHFIPKGAKIPPKVVGVPMPKSVVGKHLPRQVIESPFNVQKPRGMTKGEFFELHYGVDPSYGGGRRRGGGGWKGKELGWEKYDLAGRLWHGSPGPLKDAAWVTATTPAFGYELMDEGNLSEENFGR